MNELVAELFKGIDQKLISEEVKAKVIEMINKSVDARVEAKTNDVLAQNKTLVAENTKLVAEMETLKKEVEEKEAFLKEAASDFGKNLAEEFAEKEEVLFETLKEYQNVTEQILQETAEQYKGILENEAFEAAQEYKVFVEATSMEAAAQFRKMREAADAEQLTKFKSDIIEKADQYIQSELKKTIPQNIMEAAAEAAALKPLVESMVNVIEKHGISVDKTGFETLKAAKTENTKLSESLNVKTQETVKLGARVKELEKQVKLTQLTEGMTQAQKSKAVKLLESCSVEELEPKFKAIKDIIVEQSAKPKTVSAKDVPSQAAVDVANKQVNRIVESINKPVDGKSQEMEVWAENLARMRRS
jgi:cell division protein FtsB